MSLIHIARNGEVQGQFTDDEVKEGVNSGRFLLTDLAWRTNMAQWTPLSTWPEFSAGAAALVGAPAIPPPEIPAPLPAPAWERREELGTFIALRGSIKAVLMQPNKTFAAMPITGGLMRPYAYSFILQTIGNAVVSIFYALILFIMFRMSDTNNSLRTDPFGEAIMNLGPFAFALLLFLGTTLVTAIGIFITPAITHVSLLLTKGAKAPFEATFRVSAYTWGTFALLYCPLNALGMIPLAGMIFSMIGMGLIAWFVVINILGLQAVHKGAELWRLILGYFLPMIVCCILSFIAMIAIFGAAVASGGFKH